MFNRRPQLPLPAPHVSDPDLVVKTRELTEQRERIATLRLRVQLQRRGQT